MIPFCEETELAILAAKEAGAYLKESFGQSVQIETKKDRTYVSRVDKKSQDIIQSIIHSKFPEDSFLGEENPNPTNSNLERLWIVDPLDGTNNFLLGIPHFCVSIAFLKQDKNISAVIYQPITGELYVAETGKGAFLNYKPLNAIYSNTIQSVIVGRYFSENSQSLQISDRLNLLHDFLSGFDSVRSLGAAALDICYIASGKSSLFWQRGLQIWDVAAAELIAREAGLQICNEQGQSFQRAKDSSLICTWDSLASYKLIQILSK